VNANKRFEVAGKSSLQNVEIATSLLEDKKEKIIVPFDLIF